MSLHLLTSHAEFDRSRPQPHTRDMQIRIELDENVVRCAGEKAQAIGISLEQAVASYIQRISDGTETLEDDLLAGGSPMGPTLRQQIYRLSA